MPTCWRLRPKSFVARVVNIACGECITLNEIVGLINQALGTNLQADYQAPRVGDVLHSLADLSAAQRIIGYEPKVMFAEGLTRSIELVSAESILDDAAGLFSDTDVVM